MPELGDIARGDQIGKTATTMRSWYGWIACVDCGVPRWATLKSKVSRRAVSPRCRPCHSLTPEAAVGRKASPPPLFGEANPRWNGGRRVDGHGYILVYIHRGDFFYEMTGRSPYVFEHRLVMAKHLGRNLQSWEVVHHKNHVRDDNRLENLELSETVQHHQFTLLEERVRHLTNANAGLVQELDDLRQHYESEIAELEGK